MKRSSAVRAAGIVLLAGGLCFLSTARAHVASAQDNQYCPGGFTWERTSGQCCVQVRTTLPAHGKIGYTGNSLCEDGWFEVYDRRLTPNGVGPPGCPGYTSFVFLLECASSPEEAQRRQAEIDAGASGASPSSSASGGGKISAISDALFHGGSMPSPKDLALAGGAATALLATLGASTLRGSGGAASDRRTRDLMNQLKANERAFEEAQRSLEKATQERDAMQRHRSELRRIASQIEQSVNELSKGIEQCDYNLGVASDAKFAFAALGLVAAVAALAPLAFGGPAAVTATGAAETGAFEAALGQLAAGFEKIAADIAVAMAKLGVTGFNTVLGLWAGLDRSTPWQKLKDSLNSLKTANARLAGRAQDNLDELDKAYE